MEPITLIAKAIAIACLTAIPLSPATVPGEIEMTTVSNTTVITSTADLIDAEEKAAAKAAAEKAAAEKAAAEKAAAEKAAKEKAEADKAAAEKAAKEKVASTTKAFATMGIKVTNQQPETASLEFPLKPGSYTYTSGYGSRCAPVAGAGDFHHGVDLAAPLGTPIYSFADGTVTTVIDGVTGGQAGIVAIESFVKGNLVTHMYAHMGNSSQYVKVGDVVKAGDHISNVASTGMSTGAHLHLELWEGVMNSGTHLNPTEYFPEIGLDVLGKAKNYVAPVTSSCKSSK